MVRPFCEEGVGPGRPKRKPGEGVLRDGTREEPKSEREAGGGPDGVVERVVRLDHSGRPAGVVEGRFPDERRRDEPGVEGE